MLFQLDEINQLFLPYMRNKLLWFYQEVEEVELPPPVETVSLCKGHVLSAVINLKH
jgi:hypothetical protein